MIGTLTFKGNAHENLASQLTCIDARCEFKVAETTGDATRLQLGLPTAPPETVNGRTFYFGRVTAAGELVVPLDEFGAAIDFVSKASMYETIGKLTATDPGEVLRAVEPELETIIAESHGKPSTSVRFDRTTGIWQVSRQKEAPKAKPAGDVGAVMAGGLLVLAVVAIFYVRRQMRG